jgi:RNA-binding protein 5/10
MNPPLPPPTFPFILPFRHNQLSDLHKENLAEHQQRSGAATTASALAPAGSTPSAADEAFQYRDRAKERRQKFGGDEVPRRNKLKEKYLRAMEDMESSATSSDVTGKKNLDSSNIGNKMLQKMGWKDGQGLGKSNQGRTEIVEVS